MQDFLRRKREREKSLKATQRAEREAFVQALGELELDALDEKVGSQASWVAS